MVAPQSIPVCICCLGSISPSRNELGTKYECTNTSRFAYILKIKHNEFIKSNNKPLHTIGNGSKAPNVQKCRKCFMPVCSENCSDVHQNNRYDIVIDS